MNYTDQVKAELELWKKKMRRKPSITNRLSKGMQNKINSYIPEKVHATITSVIKQMIRGVLFGAQYTTRKAQPEMSLEVTDFQVRQLIVKYRRSGAVEGAVTGAGGLLMGLADFPILLGIKMKMLFDIASLYGADVKDYKERLFILYIFQLAFSSQEHRRKVFEHIENWEQYKQQLPEDIHQFDWRIFQQEYRDYIDLAKMAQLIPGIGAVVGLIVNYRLINKLGETAMNAYRMRRL